MFYRLKLDKSIVILGCIINFSSVPSLLGNLTLCTCFPKTVGLLPFRKSQLTLFFGTQNDIFANRKTCIKNSVSIITSFDDIPQGLSFLYYILFKIRATTYKKTMQSKK